MMEKKIKNILMVTNFFPPRNCTASRRTGCLVKYLSKLGYNVVVVCEKPGARDIVDHDFVTNFPKNIETHEIASETPSKLHHYFAQCKWSCFFKLIFKFVLLGFVKPYCFYSGAKQLLQKLVKNKHFDIVIISSPPYSLYSAYGLGCFLKRKFAIPLVVDFRDIQGELDAVEPFYMKCGNFLYNAYQKYTIHHADAIVVTTSGIANLLKERNKVKVNVTVITNGFDPDDLRISNRNIKLAKFRIVYTGSIYVGCGSFRPLLDVIWKMHGDGSMLLDDVSVEFYGNINKKVLGEAFLNHPCSSIVTINPPVSWGMCKEKQNQAAILLQNSCPVTSKINGNMILTGKLFDYLAACRPILLLPSDNGIIAALLQQTGAGIAVSTGSELQHHLKNMYDEWKATGTVMFKGNLDAINCYSRKLQAEQFVEVFNQCLVK